MKRLFKKIKEIIRSYREWFEYCQAVAEDERAKGE